MAAKKRLLFDCVQNSCRSQMAEGFARLYGGVKIEVYSAASRPSGSVDPGAIEIMKEKGIGISGKSSKPLDEVPAIEFDYAATMGCKETCPSVKARVPADWRTSDPKGGSHEDYRAGRGG